MWKYFTSCTALLLIFWLPKAWMFTQNVTYLGYTHLPDHQELQHPLPGGALPELSPFLLPIIILTHLQVSAAVFFLNSVIFNPSVSHFHCPASRKSCSERGDEDRSQCDNLDDTDLAWAHPGQARWCCHSFCFSEDINTIPARGQEGSLSPLHQQHALAELHTAVRVTTQGTCKGSLPWKIKPALTHRSQQALRRGCCCTAIARKSCHRASTDTWVCHQQGQQVTSLPQRQTDVKCLVDVLGWGLALAPLVHCAFRFAERMGLWPFFTQSH